jgi:hypothetical protein
VAFFGYFLCRRKESDPSAGEAVTAIESKKPAKAPPKNKNQKQKTSTSEQKHR